MTIQTLLHCRLTNHGLAQPAPQSVQAVVRRLGAVQSQEFNDAQWSVAQRVDGLTQEAFMDAFNGGHILRTHVLRPTWHLVAPADIRWLLRLTAPRVRASLGTNDRRLGLDEAVYAQTNRLIEQALAAGTYLTRVDLADVLARAGFSLTGNALAHVMIRAEVDGLVCSGPVQGRQHTYALLDQRVPPMQPLDRDEALAELADRYATSHGPATAQDFSWWSGLTLTDARLGLTLANARLVSETIDGNTYWHVPTAPPPANLPRALLLPNFDEFLVGYADRTPLLEPTYEGPLRTPGHLLAEKTIVIDGQIVGTWRPAKAKKGYPVTWRPLRALRATEEALIEQAIQRYTAFYAPLIAP